MLLVERWDPEFASWGTPYTYSLVERQHIPNFQGDLVSQKDPPHRGMALACMDFMHQDSTPVLFPATAPPLIHELRLAFEGRMLGFYKDLQGIPAVYSSDGLERTSKVHFTHGSLDVAAVFSHVQGRFTQLIARDAAELSDERPSYTISIFL